MRLRDAYGAAVSSRLVLGGVDSDRIHLPLTIAAKEKLDPAAGELIEHGRWTHRNLTSLGIICNEVNCACCWLFSLSKEWYLEVSVSFSARSEL